MGPEGDLGAWRDAMLPDMCDDEAWDEVVHEILEGMI